MKEKHRFSIIGGGVIGCSIAHALSKDIGEDVVLLEREFIASGSTGLSAGILSHQLWDETNIKLVRRSVDWIEKASAEQEGLELRRNGLLRVICSEEEIEPLERNVDLQKKAGANVRFLQPNEVSEISKEIAVDDLVGASYCPDDSYVDPYQLCICLARLAEERGVRILQKSEVREVEIRQEHGFELRTARDTIETETVILSSGPWSKKVAHMFGIDLPLKPYRTQAAITTPFMDGIEIPMVHDVTNDLYLKPETGGTVLAGNGTEDFESDPDNFKERAGFDFMASISEKMLRRLPRSKNASLVRGWAGLCTATPDRNPLIGFHSDIPGLFLTVGLNALGVMRGPAIGEVVGDIILERRPKKDFARYNPNRFGKIEDFDIVQGFTL